MTDHQEILMEIKRLGDRLDATLRECSALVSSVAIASGIPGLDTPEKVASACKLVHAEIAKMMREGSVV